MHDEGEGRVNGALNSAQEKTSAHSRMSFFELLSGVMAGRVLRTAAQGKTSAHLKISFLRNFWFAVLRYGDIRKTHVPFTAERFSRM